MNNAFKKGVIQLEEKVFIEADAFNGCVLVFLEIIEVKQDTKTHKKGEFKEVRNEFYYPRIAQALVKYVEVTQNDSESIKEAIEINKSIYLLIDAIDKTFKQF